MVGNNRGQTTVFSLLCGYQDAVERLQLTLRQASHLAYERYPSAAIRLGDIKRNTRALGCLVWIGVKSCIATFCPFPRKNSSELNGLDGVLGK